jgi:DNA-binding CsgD family transcriptional regulator
MSPRPVTVAVLAARVASRPAATVAIVAERRLAVAGLSAILLRDPDYQLVVEAKGIARVREVLAAYRPVVLVVEGASDEGARIGSVDSRATSLLFVDPQEEPDAFIESVRSALSRARALPVGARPRLSDREREILARIASGHSTKEVARDCRISSKTVGNHVNNICQKLHVRHRGQLIRFAIEEGLATLEPAPA